VSIARSASFGSSYGSEILVNYFWTFHWLVAFLILSIAFCFTCKGMLGAEP